jgi:hypothetical protein
MTVCKQSGHNVSVYVVSFGLMEVIKGNYLSYCRPHFDSKKTAVRGEEIIWDDNVLVVTLVPVVNKKSTSHNPSNYTCARARSCDAIRTHSIEMYVMRTPRKLPVYLLVSFWFASFLECMLYPCNLSEYNRLSIWVSYDPKHYIFVIFPFMCVWLQVVIHPIQKWWVCNGLCLPLLEVADNG